MGLGVGVLAAVHDALGELEAKETNLVDHLDQTS